MGDNHTCVQGDLDRGTQTVRAAIPPECSRERGGTAVAVVRVQDSRRDAPPSVGRIRRHHLPLDAERGRRGSDRTGR